MIRLFVAIPVPEPALSALQARLRDLRSRKWPVRWVREDGLHLTLKFLGWVEDTRPSIWISCLPITGLQERQHSRASMTLSP